MHIDTIGNYVIQLELGPIENAGYRVYRMTYHKHREGNPIKRKKQIPRLKFVSVHKTEDEARQAIEQLDTTQD